MSEIKLPRNPPRDNYLSTARESRPSREGRVFRLASEPRTEQDRHESRSLSLRFPRFYARQGRTQRQQLGKSGCGLAFTRHQKREPARVRLGRESQSGGWHRPHGPSRYPSTPLPQGADGLRANRSTCKGNLAPGGVGSPDPRERKPRRLRRVGCHNRITFVEPGADVDEVVR